MLEVGGLPTWSARESTRSNFHGWGEIAMKSGVRVVKREDREAASNSVVVDDTTMVQRSTPESIVKDWITASRERRRNQAANCLQEIRRWDKNRIVALGQSAAMVVLSFLILMSFARGSASAKPLAKNTANDSTFHSPLVEDHFVTVESLRVHYIDTGRGPTVLMIHGNAGSVEDFEFKALPLLSAEYRVFAIDRPGHGSSDRPAGKTATLEFQAELLHRTISSLGIVQPILVGHSWGASLALAYTLRYPGEVSAMVLLAPAAYPDNGGNGLLRTAVRAPLIGDLGLYLGKAIVGRRLLRRGLAQAFYPQPPSDRYVKMVSSLWLGRKQVKAYLEDEACLNDSLRNISKRYSEIEIPVVIVTGDKDKIVSPDENARALHAAIPQSRLLEIKDAGHEIPQTHPESIETALRLISFSSAS